VKTVIIIHRGDRPSKMASHLTGQAEYAEK